MLGLEYIREKGHFCGCWCPCYVAICDRRNLWRCRNLWLKVSQFVTGVAICDGKCRNLWQRQNMQFNGIYSINFDEYVVLSSYIYQYETYLSHLSLHGVSNINKFIYKLFGHSNNLVMAQNPKSENDVRSLQQWYPKYLEHLFSAISYNPEVHSGTSCLVNYIQYIWLLTRKLVNTQPLKFLSKLNLGTLLNTHFQCYLTEFATAQSWSRIATNHKLRRL